MISGQKLLGTLWNHTIKGTQHWSGHRRWWTQGQPHSSRSWVKVQGPQLNNVISGIISQSHSYVLAKGQTGHGQRSLGSSSKVTWVKLKLMLMILGGGLTSMSSCILYFNIKLRQCASTCLLVLVEFVSRFLSVTPIDYDYFIPKLNCLIQGIRCPALSFLITYHTPQWPSSTFACKCLYILYI